MRPVAPYCWCVRVIISSCCVCSAFVVLCVVIVSMWDWHTAYSSLMDEYFVAFCSLNFITRHCVLFTVRSCSPCLYTVCVLTTEEQSVLYRSLAAIHLCSVQFVPCYASADDCSLPITFNIILYVSLWNFCTRRSYGTHSVFVCVCLHNSQACLIVSLLVNVRCTHCNASRVVFLMWPLYMHCRLLLCSSYGLRWGGGFGLIALNWGFGVTALERGFGVTALKCGFCGWSGCSKGSKISLGNIICSSFRWLFLVYSA